MSVKNMHQNFLNAPSEFTGGNEDKGNFIQMRQVFKVKPLKTPKPDIPSKKTAYSLFCKDIWKIKKELQGVPVSQASPKLSKNVKLI